MTCIRCTCSWIHTRLYRFPGDQNTVYRFWDWTLPILKGQCPNSGMCHDMFMIADYIWWYFMACHDIPSYVLICIYIWYVMMCDNIWLYFIIFDDTWASLQQGHPDELRGTLPPCCDHGTCSTWATVNPPLGEAFCAEPAHHHSITWQWLTNNLQLQAKIATNQPACEAL